MNFLIVILLKILIIILRTFQITSWIFELFIRLILSPFAFIFFGISFDDSLDIDNFIVPAAFAHLVTEIDLFIYSLKNFLK